MEEVEEWRREKNILVEGEACKPVTSWIEAMLPDYIGDYIKEKHFVEVRQRGSRVSCAWRQLADCLPRA